MALTQISKDGVKADLIDGTKIADDAINSEHYTDGSIDLVHMSANSVDSDQYVDGSIDTAHIAADQITGALIADDAVGAEHIEDLDANVKWLDSQKAVFGAGDDLQIYHTGTKSFIDDTGDGALVLRSNNAVDIKDSDGIMMAAFNKDADVKLYHDGSVKFETESWGVRHYGGAQADGTGYFKVNDDGDFYAGNDEDLKIWHDGSNTYINNSTGILRVRGSEIRLCHTDNETYFTGIANGAAKLYYDDSVRLETTSNGVKVAAPEGGMAELLLYADEGDDADDKFRVVVDNSAPDFYIQNFKNGSSWENSLRLVADGGAHLYHNNSLVLETISTGVKTQGSGQWGLYCGATNAGGAFIFLDGDSNGDFSGSDYAHIGHNTNGDLEVAAKRPSGGNAAVSLKAYDGSADSQSNAFIAAHDAVWSYHALYPWTDDNRDLGYSGRRWDDIYATNSSIQTSDRNTKDNITNTDLGLSFINKLTPKSYKFKGKTRTHYGLIAQDVETVLSDISKPTSGFAGFIKSDVPVDYYTQYDESIPEGKSVGDVKNAAHTTYGLRYSEFIAPLIKAVQELSAKVTALEAK